jgi:uncharacterized protein
MKLSKMQARRFLLLHQRLLPPREALGKAGALACVRSLGCVQFDPLDQVGNNPHLVLQARVAGYRRAMLEDLLYKDRLLFDGFDKQLSVLPVEAWPGLSRGRLATTDWYEAGNLLLMETQRHVLEEIGARGALCSADFEARGKVDWPWGPTNAVRAALESLYFLGGLVVHHKAGTRKYYDLADRHIPGEFLHAPDPNPGDARYFQWRVLRRVGGIGLVWGRAGDAWLGIGGLDAARRTEATAALITSGELAEVEVEGIHYPFYLRAQVAPELEDAMQSDETVPHMAFIAPLDNLIWDRKLIRALFGFEYTWEVYVPKPKRKYGYYVLPVLYGDRFVARFEPKFDKKTKALELANWWWEEGMKPDAEMKRAFRECLQEFMGYLGAEDVIYGKEYKGLTF